jgi:hypothetical protein
VFVSRFPSYSEQAGLAFSYITNTEMGCLEPEGILEQETQYLTALREAGRYRLSEGQLEIFTARGEVLIYGPAPTEDNTNHEPPTDSNPAVTISPASGTPGTVVHVVASGFPANTIVSVAMGPQSSLSWDVAFTEVAEGTTDANGVFSVEVPAEGAPGVDLVFDVTADGQRGATSAEMFHITHGEPVVTISPTSGPSGTVVRGIANGFPGNAPVSVGVAPQNSEFSDVARGTTDANGVFSVEVSAEGAPGMDLVFAVGAEGQRGITSAEMFHITGGEPTVRISPTSGPSGTLVQVVASGFPSDTPVSVGLGPANSQFSEAARGTTDANGSFSVQVVVQGAPGMDLVFAVATMGQSGVTSIEVFHVTD